MATLQSGKSAGQRLKAGRTVLDRSKSVDARAVKKKLSDLASVQRQYDAAHAAAAKANAALIAQERVVGALDDAQDACVDKWAGARSAAGHKRTQPFADLRAPAVSVIQKMDTAKECALIKKMAAADKKHPDAAVRKAAAAAASAADAVLRAMKPLDALLRARDAAINARDAIGPRWEKSFSSLKRAAKAAEDDGATGLHAALFEVAPRAKKKPAAPAPAVSAPATVG